mmetsp:Transcript_103024/g.332023  ORF Transcript_103024/g.332023 Transcript_103024/m.332023 type:complete len:688 (-) Transcript_103024:83-2146(-)
MAGRLEGGRRGGRGDGRRGGGGGKGDGHRGGKIGGGGGGSGGEGVGRGGGKGGNWMEDHKPRGSGPDRGPREGDREPEPEWVGTITEQGKIDCPALGNDVLIQGQHSSNAFRPGDRVCFEVVHRSGKPVASRVWHWQLPLQEEYEHHEEHCPEDGEEYYDLDAHDQQGYQASQSHGLLADGEARDGRPPEPAELWPPQPPDPSALLAAITAGSGMPSHLGGPGHAELAGPTTASTSSSAFPSRKSAQPNQRQQRPMLQGVVKAIGSNYAFVSCREVYDMYGRDVFVPPKEMDNLDLSVGDAVSFSVRVQQEKPQALNLQIVEKAESRPHLASAASGAPEEAGTGREAAGDEDHTRYTGSIKSFNNESGYGFLSCRETLDRYGLDVFLHSKQIKEFNVGDNVTFEVQVSKTGKPQANDLREVPKTLLWLCAEGDAVEAAADSSPPKAAAKDVGGATVEGESKKEPSNKAKTGSKKQELHTGEIKSFNTMKGYGFIECPELFVRFGRDVFLHESQFEGKRVGDRVKFKLQVKNDQPQARDVNLDESSATAEQATSSAPPKRSEEEEAAAVAKEQEQLNKRLLRACASVRLEALESMRELLLARAEPNLVDVTGQTPIMISALNVRHSERKCKLLIEHRADLDVHCFGELTAIQWARERINGKFAAFLEATRSGTPLDYDMLLEAPRDDF